MLAIVDGFIAAFVEGVLLVSFAVLGRIAVGRSARRRRRARHDLPPGRASGSLRPAPGAGERPSVLSGSSSSARAALLALSRRCAAAARGRAGGGDADREPLGRARRLHPAHGGGWTSHALRGVRGRRATPSVAASRRRRDRARAAHVDRRRHRGQGSLGERVHDGGRRPRARRPAAAGQPGRVVSASGGSTVWYRTSLGDLEVVRRPGAAPPWIATDVTRRSAAGRSSRGPDGRRRGHGSSGYAITPGDASSRSRLRPRATAVDGDGPDQGPRVPGAPGSLAVLAAPDGSRRPCSSPASTRRRDPALRRAPRSRARSARGTRPTSRRSARRRAPARLRGSDRSPSPSYVTTGPATSWRSPSRSGLAGGFTVVDLTRVSDVAGADGAEPIAFGGPMARPSRCAPRRRPRRSPRSAVRARQRTSRSSAARPSSSTRTRGRPSSVAPSCSSPPTAARSRRRRFATRSCCVAASFDQQHRGSRRPRQLELQPLHRGVRARLVVRLPARERRRGVVLGLRAVRLADLRRPHARDHRVERDVRPLGRGAPSRAVRDALPARPGDAIVWGPAPPALRHARRDHRRRSAASTSTSCRGTPTATSRTSASGVWRSGPFVGADLDGERLPRPRGGPAVTTRGPGGRQ